MFFVEKSMIDKPVSNLIFCQFAFRPLVARIIPVGIFDDIHFLPPKFEHLHFFNWHAFGNDLIQLLDILGLMAVAGKRQY